MLEGDGATRSGHGAVNRRADHVLNFVFFLLGSSFVTLVWVAFGAARLILLLGNVVDSMFWCEWHKNSIDSEFYLRLKLTRV